MIVRSITHPSQFRHAFEVMDRGNQYTYAGFNALFEYLDELSEDLGQPIELDPIAICCGWSEFEGFREAAAEYGIDLTSFDQDDDPTTLDDESQEGKAWEHTIDRLADMGTVVVFDEGILFTEGW